jgi:hypothetical protein
MEHTFLELDFGDIAPKIALEPVKLQQLRKCKRNKRKFWKS